MLGRDCHSLQDKLSVQCMEGRADDVMDRIADDVMDGRADYVEPSTSFGGQTTMSCRCCIEVFIVLHFSFALILLKLSSISLLFE